MNRNKNIAFYERLVTEVRSAIMESPLRPRVPLPRFYRVKGKYLLRVNINGRVYSACLGAKLDEEALLRGLQELLKLVGDRVQASSSPRARDSHKGLSALTALVALFSVAR
jgi:hypothetical protein